MGVEGRGEVKKEWEAENIKMKKSAGAGVVSTNKTGSKDRSRTTPASNGGVNVTGKLNRLNVFR